MAKHNGRLIALVAVIITSAAIGICVSPLQTVTPAIAINGVELNSLRGGNLIIMTNESDTHSSYSKEWPNIHSNIKQILIQTYRSQKFKKQLSFILLQ